MLGGLGINAVISHYNGFDYFIKFKKLKKTTYHNELTDFIIVYNELTNIIIVYNELTV